MTFREVSSGELITAGQWNALVAAVEALEGRVERLERGESDGPPVIVRVLPTGPVTAGDVIQIFGRNFDFSRGGSSVFFGSTPAPNILPGSSDVKLIVQVPDPVAGATVAGASITLTVANLKATTSQAITVKARPVLPTGGIEVSYQGSVPATPTRNLPIEFTFLLVSNTNTDTMVTITPVTQGQGGGPIVPNNSLQVIDSDNRVSTDRRIPLPEGTAKPIRVRIPTIPNSLADGTKFTVQITATAPGLAAVPESTPVLAVGLASEQPDSTVTNFNYLRTEIGEAVLTPSTDAQLDGVLTIPGGTTATISLDATFANLTEPTTYALSAQVDPPTSGWSAAVNPLTPTQLTVNPPGQQQFPNFDLTVPTTGGPVNVRLTTTRQGATTNNRRSVTFRVQRKP